MQLLFGLTCALMTYYYHYFSVSLWTFQNEPSPPLSKCNEFQNLRGKIARKWFYRHFGHFHSGNAKSLVVKTCIKQHWNKNGKDAVASKLLKWPMAIYQTLDWLLPATCSLRSNAVDSKAVERLTPNADFTKFRYAASRFSSRKSCSCTKIL